MQRLTKYSLLLKAILKKTDDGLTRNNLILMVRKTERGRGQRARGSEKKTCVNRRAGPLAFTEEFVELKLVLLIGKVCSKRNFFPRQNANLKKIFL